MTGPRRARVLFVCIGNMCRSPMAEGFARQLAGDRLEIYSAGVAPSGHVSETATAVMAERGIDISTQRSKGLPSVPIARMDWIVSLGEVSASAIAPKGFAGRVEDWRVRDPVGESIAVYRATRDAIEAQVRALVDRIDAEFGGPSDERGALGGDRP